MVDLASTVREFKGSAPVAGVTDAWYWSPAPGLHFCGTLTEDGSRLLQFHFRGPGDEQMVRSITAFARAHGAELTAADPIAAVSGFRCEGRPFDTVAALAPVIAKPYSYERPELTPHVYVMYPGYACEFADGQTEAETLAKERFADPGALDRKPVPFVRMRFRNDRTGAGSMGDERGVARPDVLWHELAELENSPGFVEFENRRRQVWRVEWDGTYRVTESAAPQAAGSREYGREELLAFARERVEG
ncbi:hypothetical protein [Streptomyces sp. YIM 98790]|uniref:hypothetical protein n=1 Tax=Streptomyces sp. YIM 98790 TaxID=2689077 RepID=UPI00140939CF|nr:hypothetical protein [Streptomyces sp. YIM 98790]